MKIIMESIILIIIFIINNNKYNCKVSKVK